MLQRNVTTSMSGISLSITLTCLKIIPCLMESIRFTGYEKIILQSFISNNKKFTTVSNRKQKFDIQFVRHPLKMNHVDLSYRTARSWQLMFLRRMWLRSCFLNMACLCCDSKINTVALKRISVESKSLAISAQAW